MQLKKEPPGFIEAVQKHKITEVLLDAMSALSLAGGRLDLIDHESGRRMMADYQAGIKQLIAEIGQLQPPAEANLALSGRPSVSESQSCSAPGSERR